MIYLLRKSLCIQMPTKETVNRSGTHVCQSDGYHQWIYRGENQANDGNWQTEISQHETWEHQWKSIF